MKTILFFLLLLCCGCVSTKEDAKQNNDPKLEDLSPHYLPPSHFGTIIF